MWIVSRRDNLCLAGVLSEAKPPEIDAKSDVSVGIILVHG